MEPVINDKVFSIVLILPLIILMEKPFTVWNLEWEQLGYWLADHLHYITFCGPIMESTLIMIDYSLNKIYINQVKQLHKICWSGDSVVSLQQRPSLSFEEKFAELQPKGNRSRLCLEKMENGTLKLTRVSRVTLGLSVTESANTADGGTLDSSVTCHLGCQVSGLWALGWTDRRLTWQTDRRLYDS